MSELTTIENILWYDENLADERKEVADRISSEVYEMLENMQRLGLDPDKIVEKLMEVETYIVNTMVETMEEFEDE